MKIINKKFNRDYQVIETLEAGIILTGAEVKSVRHGRLKLEDSYVKFLNDGPYLINSQIAPYFFAKSINYDPKRPRKILLNKKEIIRLKTKIKSSPSLTVVPVLCYNKGGFLKLEIALARGRKNIEKRKLEKQKKIVKEKEKELKEWIKK